VGSREPAAPASRKDEIARAALLAPALAEVAEMKDEKGGWLTDPRAPFMAGFAYYKAGQEDKAKEWLAKALDRCREMRHDRVNAMICSQLVVGTARLAAVRAWKPLLKKACDDFCYVNEGNVEGAEFAAEEDKSPILLQAAELHGKWTPMYDLLSLGGPYIFRRAENLRAKIAAKVPPDALRAELVAHVEKKPSADAYRLLATFLAWVYDDPSQGAGVMRVARRKLTGESPAARARFDFDAAKMYVAAHSRGLPDGNALALEAAKAGIEAVESTPDAALEEALGHYAARLHLIVSQDRAAAKAVVERLIARGRATRDFEIGELCAFSGKLDEAVRRFESARSRGFTPYAQLARVTEALAMKAEGEERKRLALAALRYYNGERHGLHRAPSPPAGEDLLVVMEVEGASMDTMAGRARMMEMLGGEDAFLEAFLKRARPELAEGARKRIEELYKVVADEPDYEKKGAALEKLKAAAKEAGPGAAALLRGGLTHADEWVKVEIRAILAPWADPLP
jgi:hypothetical protein